MTTARICWAMLVTSIRAEMQYRMNFVTEVLFDLGYHSLGFLFLWAVVGNFGALGDWSLNDMALLYGIQLAGSSLWSLSFSRLLLMQGLVIEGHYDQMLLRPVPIALQFMFGGFRIATIGHVVGAVIILGIAIRNASIDWTAAHVVFLVSAVLGSAMIRGAFELVPAAMTFRLLGGGRASFGVEIVFRNFGIYPLDIFGSGLRGFLTFILPVAFVGWIPAAVLLGHTGSLPIPTWVAWASPALGVLLLGAAWTFFLRESRQYQSSGT